MTAAPARASEKTPLVARLRLEGAGALRDVVVTTRAGATVAEVAEQLLPGYGGALAVDGRALPPGAAWADVMPPDGTSLVTGAFPAHGTERHGSGFELAVIGGPLAGVQIPLPLGSSTVGRGSAASVRLADAELSREHLRLVVDHEGVTVTDAGSTNGCLIDGRRFTGAVFLLPDSIITMGRCLVAVRRAAPVLAPVRRADASGRRVVQRPPRLADTDSAERLTLVAPPEPAAPHRYRVPWLGVLLPLVASGLIVIFTGHLLYLVFAVLSPVMVVGNAMSEMSARRRESRSRGREYGEAQAAFQQLLDGAAAQRRLALARRLPDVAQVYGAATGPTALLWQRSGDDADFLTVRIGTTSLPADLDVRDSRGGRLPAPVLRDVPVGVDLHASAVTGVCGDGEARDAIVRSMLLQCVTLASPSDLSVCVLTSHERAALWDWAKWTPHTWTAAGTGTDVVADRDAVSAAVDRLLRQSGRSVLVVVDAVESLHASAGVAALLSAAAPGQLMVLVLANRFSGLPRACRASIQLSPDGLHCAIALAAAPAVSDVRADLLDIEVAEQAARALSGWVPPDRAVDGVAASDRIPDRLGFLDSLGSPDLSPQGLRRRWDGVTGRVPVAVCGMGRDGAVEVDLRSEAGGPNAFIAGTVGSGKSDFLRSFLVSLAVANPPDALAMILVDFKQGSGLEVLAPLPHVAAVITDADRAQMPRILKALEAEQVLRQHRVKTAGYDNFDAWQAAGTAPFPRLLIVIDEFAALRSAVEDVMDRLVSIVRLGRSAGMHLVLSTQTVTSSVSQDVVDNTTLHVSLRVESAAESRALIGTTEAAQITPRLRGRGFVTAGPDPAREFQAGWLGHRSGPGAGVRGAVAVSPFTVLAPTGSDHAGAGAGADPGSTDMDLVVAALGKAAAELGIPRASAPWEPPLPTCLTLDRVSAEKSAETEGLTIPLGLLDSPATRSQSAWLADLDSLGHLLVVGGSRSGRTTVLRTLAGSALLSTRGTHLYVIEGSGRMLQSLAAVPGVGAVVAADDAERLGRLIHLLKEEVHHRQVRMQGLGVGSLGEWRRSDPAAPANLVLLVDGFEALHDEAVGEEGLGVVGDLTALLRDGPGVGLHLVVTTDASKLHTRLATSVGARLVLALPGTQHYVAAGVARDGLPAGALPPGRAIWTVTGEDVQIALLDPDPDVSAQNAAVARIAASMTSGGAALGSPQPVPFWPDTVSLGDLTASGPEVPATSLVLGVGGSTLGPVQVDLPSLVPGMLVLGPRGAGCSTTLRTLLHQLGDDRPGRPPVLVPAMEEIGDVALRLRTAEPSVVLIDDGQRALDGLAGAALDEMVAVAAERGHVIVVAAAVSDIAQQHRAWCAKLKRSRNVLLLRPPSRSDIQLLGLTPPAQAAAPIPAAGRGLLFVGGECLWVQVARSDAG